MWGWFVVIVICACVICVIHCVLSVSITNCPVSHGRNVRFPGKEVGISAVVLRWEVVVRVTRLIVRLHRSVIRPTVPSGGYRKKGSGEKGTDI